VKLRRDREQVHAGLVVVSTGSARHHSMLESLNRRSPASQHARFDVLPVVSTILRKHQSLSSRDLANVNPINVIANVVEL